MSGGKDQRVHARHFVIAEVEYKSEHQLLKARLSDLSLGGLFLDTVNVLDLGTEVTFRFSLPQDQSGAPIVGKGVVSWHQPHVGMGVRFTKMSREDWGRIKAFLQRQPK